MNELVLIIWVIGTLIGFFALGYKSGNETLDDESNLVLSIVCVFWPVVLAVTIIVLPFMAVAILGKKIGERENHE